MDSLLLLLLRPSHALFIARYYIVICKTVCRCAYIYYDTVNSVLRFPVLSTNAQFISIAIHHLFLPGPIPHPPGSLVLTKQLSAQSPACSLFQLRPRRSSSTVSLVKDRIICSLLQRIWIRHRNTSHPSSFQIPTLIHPTHRLPCYLLLIECWKPSASLAS